MTTSSDFRGAVVVVDVLARLVAARRTLVALGGQGWLRWICYQGRRGGGAAGTDSEKEVTAGQTLRTLGHALPPVLIRRSIGDDFSIKRLMHKF
jgi:hypothetical protein